MRLSDISIKNPVLAWMIMISLIVFGAISFSKMGISQYPDIDFPMVNVSVAYTGASPEVMEQNVVQPLEDALTSLEGVKSLYSTSRTGTANISIEFNLERNIDAAIQEVGTRVNQAMRKLPSNIEAPIISKMNPEDQPIIIVTLSSKTGDLRALMKYAQGFLKDRYTNLDGVGDVSLAGFVDPIIEIKVDLKRLDKYGIVINDIVDAIKSEHIDIAAGQIWDSKQVFNLAVKGEVSRIEGLRNLYVTKRAGQSNANVFSKVRLSDVADINLGLAKKLSTSRYNKNTTVALAIKKQRGTNAVAVADSVLAETEKIKKMVPADFQIDTTYNATQFIKNSIHELNQHLILAVILTALVCLLFLGSWSATFNVLLSIPTSLFGAFIVLYFLGYTLNTFTLLGLTLSIGIVVDDAIMVLENIFRHKEMHKGRIQSAIIGAREITFAAIAATAAVVAIFLPVVFMKGVIGRFFMQFGVAISVAVLFSLLEALTITPMRAAHYLSEGHRTTWIGKTFEQLFSKLQNLYIRTLKLSLQHKVKVVVGSLILVCASFYSVKFVKQEFMPSQDSGFINVRAQWPVGTSFDVTNEQSKKIEDWLLSQPQVAKLTANIGSSGYGGSSDPNKASFMLILKPKSERKQPLQDFYTTIRKNLKTITPTAQISISDPTTRAFGGGRGAPVEVVVKGPDISVLVEKTNQLILLMKDSGIVTDVDSNIDSGLPEIQIIPNRESLLDHGITTLNMGTTISNLVNGLTVDQFTESGTRYNIVLSLKNSENQMNDLQNLSVPNSKGNAVKINKISALKNEKTLQQINRVNRNRAVSITAQLLPQATVAQAWDFVQRQSKTLLPAGYVIEQAGTTKEQKETFTSLLFALLLGLLVAYMIIGAQFNSFLDPVTILIALPYSIAGALLGLLLTGQSLNMYSLIGVVLLMGIVKKNSILLVDFANRELQANNHLDQAVINSGASRFRPILMTSLATVAGAIPTAIATGEGAEVTRSMAITIIFGVVFSTALTLYVVPALYTLIHGLKKQQKTENDIKDAFDQAGTEGL